MPLIRYALRLGFIIIVSVVLFKSAPFISQLDRYIVQGTSVVAYPFIKGYHAITYPFEQGVHWIAHTVHQENKIRILNRRYEELLASYAALAEKYILYRDVAALVRTKEFASAQCGLLTRIIHREINHANHCILVDVGSMHGIALDMVAVYKNNLVGRVVDVTPFYSKVMLITDKRVKIGAVCVKTEAKGMYSGIQEPRSAHVLHVSHLSEIIPGDFVMSHGQGLVYPRGFLLGEIREARKNGVYYEIELKPCIDFDSLEYCSIIEKK